MKNKKNIKKLGALMLIGAMMVPTASYAREIGSLKYYKITTKEQTSPYLRKTKNYDVVGGRYVFNFESTASGDSSAGVKHRLVNSNGSSRSKSTITQSGKRSVCQNTASANYLYAVVTESGDLFDKDFFINASWSPDEN